MVSGVTSPGPARIEGEAEPTPKTSPELAPSRVKHMAKDRKFGPRELLAGIISEAERMWGKLVIRPSDADEVCQESAFSGNESGGDDDEEATTP